MTPTERVEKIVYDNSYGDATTVTIRVHKKDLTNAIAAQIEEAEREAYAELYKEKCKAAEDGYRLGFNAAREKAKGLIDNLLTHHNQNCSMVAQLFAPAPEFSGRLYCPAHRGDGGR